MKYTTEEIKQAYNYLKQLKAEGKLNRIGAMVKHVSRSGMTRRIEFYSENLNRIGYYIAKIISYPYNIDKGGINVSGCGMDMIFHVLTSLNYAMMKLNNPGKEWKEIDTSNYGSYFINANNYKEL